MKEKLVIIGANEFQLPLILRAKEKGMETHVFAWEEGAVGREYADCFYPVSIVEKERILEECRQIRPAGIASIGSDLAMLTVNEIAGRLGLTANTMACTELSTNKYNMRKAFREHDDPSPRYCLDTEKEGLGQLRYPVIVKPTDRSGSRGVRKLDSPEKLEEAVAQARDCSFDGRAIVEEFIDGKEYSVEFISWEGEHTFLALTEKFTTGAPHFIETGHREPAGVPAPVLKRIKTVVAHALDSLQIRYGASHAEVLVRPDGGVFLVEIGGRMGGDCIGSHLVKLSTGYDYVDMVIETACGRRPEFRRVCSPRPVAVRFLFGPADLEAAERIRREEPEKLYCAVQTRPFDGHAVTDSSARYGYYIVYED